MINSSLLQRFNLHWTTGKISEDLAKPFKRSVYFDALDRLEYRQVVVITGLRRVGKSTTMFQLIHELLSRGVAPRNILYFSFDGEKNSVEEVLETYEQDVLTKSFGALEERIYIFLDEVQYSKGWEGKLKTYYDLYPKIKFVVSGSASLLVEKSVRERLAGRFFTLPVSPLDFREFSAMKKAPLERVEFNFAKLKEAYLKQTVALPLFLEFVRKGGFPELTLESNEIIVAEYIRNSVVDRVVFKDFALLEDKRDFELFEKIINLTCANPGMLTSYANISNDLKRDRRTISNYFRLLAYAMLLFQTSNYRKGAISIRKLPKTYVASTGIIFSLYPQSFGEKETLSKIIENLVVVSCNAKYYWRRGKNEVNIVLEQNQKLIPIEIKFRKEIGIKDMKGLLRFMDENNIDFGIIISEATLNEIKLNKKTIWIIPAWLFLLVDGRSIID